MDDERRELVLDVDIGDQATNVVDAGGNGVVYSLMINGQLYAVKLVSHNTELNTHGWDFHLPLY